MLNFSLARLIDSRLKKVVIEPTPTQRSEIAVFVNALLAARGNINLSRKIAENIGLWLLTNDFEDGWVCLNSISRSTDALLTSVLQTIVYKTTFVNSRFPIIDMPRVRIISAE